MTDATQGYSAKAEDAQVRVERSRWERFAIAARKAPWSARIGFAIVLAYAFVAIFAPVLAPHGEAEVFPTPFAPWGGDHVFGTDQIGRDILSRLIFFDITWPQVIPVAATVMLIRVIEAFKIVDLPNIMTAGGPGIATESMSLHSLFSWRALDLGQSAAVAYLLLFVTVVICVSFFNLVVLNRLRQG